MAYVMEQDAIILLNIWYCRDATPNCLKDIILLLQKKHGVKIPNSDQEWADTPRTSICIRRSMVLQDGLKEASKARFDPMNLLKVCFYD